MAKPKDFLERKLVADLGGRFAKNLRVRRERMRQSQADVAEGMRNCYGFKWHQTMVAKVENGDRAVRLDEAFALSRLLGIELDDMIRGERMGEVENGRVAVFVEDGRVKVYVGSARHSTLDLIDGERVLIDDLVSAGREVLAHGPPRPYLHGAPEMTGDDEAWRVRSYQRDRLTVFEESDHGLYPEA